MDGPSPFGVVASVLKEGAETCLVDAEHLVSLGMPEEDVVLTEPAPGLDCFVLDNVLSEEQCRYLVEMTEKMEYTFWDSREEKRVDFRNADTIEVFSEEVAVVLWDRIHKVMEDKIIRVKEGDYTNDRWQRDLEGEWKPYGTNRHLLFARYESDGHFSPHTDGYSVETCDERSMYSIVMYLNTCQDGGGTRFYKNEQKDRLVKDDLDRYTGQPDLELVTVEPIVGRIAIFFHNILHQGVPVGRGCKKYIIRSDVMYRRTDPICKTEKDKEAFDMYQQAQELSTAGEIDESMRLFRRAFKMSSALADVYGM
mmetsp:Transcript_10856/g.17235  ORF Transcript_10856/g.17235 Transcript_10856/m.17235 type:complete len:310 (+) Transcript_10856:2-931(+)